MPTQYLNHGVSLAVDSVSAVTVDEGIPFPPVPDGAKVITAEEYAEALSAIKTVVRESRAATEATEREEAKDAYDALRAAGISDKVARRLIGYVPTEVKPEKTR